MLDNSFKVVSRRERERERESWRLYEELNRRKKDSV